MIKAQTLGILVAFGFFLRSMRAFTKAFGLKFYKFLSFLYLFVGLPYLLGRWMQMVLSYKIFFPTNLDQLKALLFAPDLGFHF